MDVSVAKWLLETSLELDPTPSVQYFLARALLLESQADNAAAEAAHVKRVNDNCGKLNSRARQ